MGTANGNNIVLSEIGSGIGCAWVTSGERSCGSFDEILG